MSAYLYPTVRRLSFNTDLHVTVHLCAPTDWAFPRDCETTRRFKDGLPDVNGAVAYLTERYVQRMCSYADLTEEMLRTLGYAGPIRHPERLSHCLLIPDVRSYSEYISISTSLTVTRTDAPYSSTVRVSEEEVAGDIEAVAQAIRICRQNLLHDLADYVTYLRSIILTLSAE